MHKLLSAKKIAFTFTVASLLFSGLSFIFAPQSVSAAKSVDSCSLVVEKSACQKEVKQCPNTDRRDECEKAIVHKSKYHAVYQVCRDRQNPQTCHKGVKSKCTGKSGAELTKCKESTAKKYPEKKAAKASVNESFTFGDKPEANGTCGEGPNAVETRFDFGCQGKGSPIEDAAYAIISFLSIGVGLVLVASIIYAGIQYSSSEGNPEATQAAKKRVQNAIIGLVFYLFIFALVQFLVPGGLFS